MHIYAFVSVRKLLFISTALAAIFASYSNVAQAITAKVNNFTNSNWLQGIWRQSAGFSIPSNAANQAAFVPGTSVRFADSQARKITMAFVLENSMSVYVDGAQLDGNTVGYPNFVSTGTTTDAAPTAQVANPINLVGVNLAGADFSGTAYPGVYGTQYIYPGESYFKKYADMGMKLVRLPFLWERIQPTLNTELQSAELARLMQCLDYAQKYDVKVILNLHNYYRYYNKQIASSEVPISAFADFWQRLAQKVVNHPAVYGYDLMNEPHDTNGYWPQAALAAAKAIRTVDENRWVFIPGDQWANAYYWPNFNNRLIANPWMRDPNNNLVYEAHLYIDEDFSGTYTNHSEAFDPMLGVSRVKPFVDWLKQNKLRGYLGEHGVPDYSPSAMVAMDNLLNYLGQNCIPMTYWAAGPWWVNYPLSLDVDSGAARPQLPILQKYARNTSCSMIGPELHNLSKITAIDDTHAGQIYRLYQTAFDRLPDEAGLDYWIDQMDAGVSLQRVAQGFINSNEFQQRYGYATNNQSFISMLYMNVLNRQPDPPGLAFWQNRMAQGVPRAEVLSAFSESSENKANAAKKALSQ
ncbi:endoglucanase [Azomonas macrocytogenes]|uniref:Endoglucanase n=2 Tax=Azomonas macrocytogenes TaxID=69962 RepID=A0A839T3Z6_AZOMA|nr:endoglucanase [Azomonas macrocytogenes]